MRWFNRRCKVSNLIFFLIFLIQLSGFLVAPAYCDQWPQIKGKHFIINYQNPHDQSFAEKVLRTSEDYYNKIADHLGFRRYGDFWTWDNRAKILLYTDQKTLTKEMGLPDWSKGAAGRDSNRHRTRVIASFKQEEGFLEGILPHEISHLILDDYLNKGSAVHGWLGEGLAQLQEKGKLEDADRIIRYHVIQGQYIPFRAMIRHDIRGEDDPAKVVLFYAQSVSVIDFLIYKYGSNKFSLLCRNLKNGKSFEESLVNAYSSVFRSIDDFEAKWLKYLSN